MSFRLVLSVVGAFALVGVGLFCLAYSAVVIVTRQQPGGDQYVLLPLAGATLCILGTIFCIAWGVLGIPPTEAMARSMQIGAAICAAAAALGWFILG